MLSVHFSHSVMSNSLHHHGLQHAWPPCPSPTPGVYSNSCPLSQWCHPTISSSVVPFSSHLQCFPASGSFQVSQLFASGGQSIGAWWAAVHGVIKSRKQLSTQIHRLSLSLLLLFATKSCPTLLRPQGL